MSQLDRHSSQSMKVFKKKGGTAGRDLGLIMAAMDKDPTVETRRDCVLKALCVYMNESSESFIKEYLEIELPTTQMEPMVLGLYLVKHEGAEPREPLADVGVIIEGVGVLRELKYLANGWAVLLGLIYSLNLSYPKELKHTFEFIQKVLMELDGNRLSTKVQVLKNRLQE